MMSPIVRVRGHDRAGRPGDRARDLSRWRYACCSLPSPTMDRPHYQFWPKRLPHAITLPATSLWDNLATSARRYPDKPALVFFGRVLTYAQLQQQAERLAARLHAIGVRKGDRVVLD